MLNTSILRSNFVNKAFVSTKGIYLLGVGVIQKASAPCVTLQICEIQALSFMNSQDK